MTIPLFLGITFGLLCLIGALSSLFYLYLPEIKGTFNYIVNMQRADRAALFSRGFFLSAGTIPILLLTIYLITQDTTILWNLLAVPILLIAAEYTRRKAKTYTIQRYHWQEQTKLRVFTYPGLVMTYRLKSWKFTPAELETKVREILIAHPDAPLKNFEQALEITIESIEKPKAAIDDVELGEGDIYLGEIDRKYGG